MSDRWQWAKETWERSFEPLRARGFELERVDHDTYWRVHESELRAHFPPEVFINLAALRGDESRSKLALLTELRDETPLRDFCIVRDGDAVVATFAGYHNAGAGYRQWHSHVHPDYRRRGIYREIVTGTIAYTGALGFDTIESEHAPGNNPVLLAKLGAGFRITALEVEPMVGLSVKLTYFHNPDHLAVYEYRCGLATLTPRIIAAGGGAMPRLRQQFRAADESDES
jgi:GNAT superfamily N-acetyltransferase